MRSASPGHDETVGLRLRYQCCPSESVRRGSAQRVRLLWIHPDKMLARKQPKLVRNKLSRHASVAAIPNGGWLLRTQNSRPAHARTRANHPLDLMNSRSVKLASSSYEHVNRCVSKHVGPWAQHLAFHSPTGPSAASDRMIIAGYASSTRYGVVRQHDPVNGGTSLPPEGLSPLPSGSRV